MPARPCVSGQPDASSWRSNVASSSSTAVATSTPSPRGLSPQAGSRPVDQRSSAQHEPEHAPVSDSKPVDTPPTASKPKAEADEGRVSTEPVSVADSPLRIEYNHGIHRASSPASETPRYETYFYSIGSTIALIDGGIKLDM
mgnify:CR=1 FL=1